ncbi:MAG TPA: DUF2283 domain-containing protein [Anaerolineae bacterium]|nr:DUF2283 domain-containing protein [Anaerolineae bacterium]
MKIRYFSDTDTVYLEMSDKPVAETVDLNENTILDLDAEGNLVAITLEHARESAGIHDFSFQQIMSEQLQPVV